MASIITIIVVAVLTVFFSRLFFRKKEKYIDATENKKDYKKIAYWVIIYLLIINSTAAFQTVLGFFSKQFGTQIYYISRIACILFIYIISLFILQKKHTLIESRKSLSFIYFIASSILAIDYIFGINDLGIEHLHNGALYVILALVSSILYLKSAGKINSRIVSSR